MVRALGAQAGRWVLCGTLRGSRALSSLGRRDGATIPRMGPPGWAGTSGGLQSTLLPGAGRSDWVSQGFVQPGLEGFPGWRLGSSFGDFFLLLCGIMGYSELGGNHKDPALEGIIKGSNPTSLCYQHPALTSVRDFYCSPCGKISCLPKIPIFIHRGTPKAVVPSL